MKKNKKASKSRRLMLAGGLTALAAVGAVAAWRAAHPHYQWCSCNGDCEPEWPEHMASPTAQCSCEADEKED